VQNILPFSLSSKNLKIKVYRNIILPVVLCGCETWSLTLRNERRLGVFGNSVLRRIFGNRRAEVTRERRQLLNEELNDLYCWMIFTAEWSVLLTWYSSGDKIDKKEMAGACGAYGWEERRDVYRFVVRKRARRSPVGRLRRRWGYNIRMDLQDVGVGLWNVFSWLRIGTGGGLLWLW
jgi:hypothetical protein